MAETNKNTLFPVFLKLEHLHTLVIGAGKIGHEKLSALLGNNPSAKITLLAKALNDDVKALLELHPHVVVIEKAFEEQDLKGIDLVVSATGDRNANVIIRKAATEKGILVNIADTPDLCDFYLGSIVQKGDLKIAISTNGKSPTMAKRIKELLSDAIPDSINESLDNLTAIRAKLKGNMEHKIKELNRITSVLKPDKKPKSFIHNWVAGLYT